MSISIAQPCMVNKVRGAFCMLAPVCASWVFMSRGTTKRCQTYPLGDESVQCVRAGNLMVARVALMIRLLHSKGVVWVLEQPSSSLLMHHPRMQALLRDGIPVYKIMVWLGAYGGTSPKCTHLYCSHPHFKSLQRRIS